MEEQKPKGSGMEKIATFIVDKRNLFFLLYAFALIFSIVATGWVKVENDITTYLPEDTETRQGLTVMNDNFVTYGTARVMVSNVTYETAENICSDLESIDGVTSVDFDDTTDHYKSASALFSVTFDGTTTDDIIVHALHTIRDMLAGYDTYIDTEVGVDTSADLQSEMSVILVLAAIVIVLALILSGFLCRGSGSDYDLWRGGFYVEYKVQLPWNHFFISNLLLLFCSWHWLLTTPSSCATASRMSTKPRIRGRPVSRHCPRQSPKSALPL